MKPLFLAAIVTSLVSKPCALLLLRKCIVYAFLAAGSIVTTTRRDATRYVPINSRDSKWGTQETCSVHLGRQGDNPI